MTSKATFLSNLFCVAMGRLMGHFRKTTFSRTGQKGPELIKKNEEQEKRNIKTCGLRAQARWTWSVARPLDNLARSPCTYGTRQQFSKGWDVPSRILEWYRIDSHKKTNYWISHGPLPPTSSSICHSWGSVLWLWLCDYADVLGDIAWNQLCRLLQMQFHSPLIWNSLGCPPSR